MFTASSKYQDPFSSWRRPNCLRSYVPPHRAAAPTKARDDRGAKTALFLRSTCSHDVCINCINIRLSRHLIESNAPAVRMILEVLFPITLGFSPNSVGF